jgi:hypothetical protein
MMLIFYFCIINDVQNRHVSVMKLFFLLGFLCADIKLGLGIKHWLKNQRD